MVQLAKFDNFLHLIRTNSGPILIDVNHRTANTDVLYFLGKDVQASGYTPVVFNGGAYETKHVGDVEKGDTINLDQGSLLAAYDRKIVVTGVDVLPEHRARKLIQDDLYPTAAGLEAVV